MHCQETVLPGKSGGWGRGPVELNFPSIVIDIG